MDILPFIEQRQLADMYTPLPETEQFFEVAYQYDTLNLSHSPPIRNLEVVKSRIPTLTCPSDEPQIDSRGITFHNYVVELRQHQSYRLGLPRPDEPSLYQVSGQSIRRRRLECEASTHR